MDTRRFWRIISKSLAALPKHTTLRRRRQCNELRGLLENLSPEEIIQFQEIYDSECAKAYHFDIRLAFYILAELSGDDAFDLFVKLLVSTGQRSFYAAIASPDAFLAKNARLFTNCLDHGMDIFSTISGVVDSKCPKDAPSKYKWHFELNGKEFDILDAKELERRAPVLWAKYGSREL